MVKRSSGTPTRTKNYFSDGNRTLDFVLIWDASSAQCRQTVAVRQRRLFERNLANEGLELEYEYSSEVSPLNVVKIHAPLPVLVKYAGILKLRKPIKRDLTQGGYITQHATTKNVVFDEEISTRIGLQNRQLMKDAAKGKFSVFLENHVYVDRKYFPESEEFRFSTVFSSDQLYLFDYDDPQFFTLRSRSRIVNFILARTMFQEAGGKNIQTFGISSLIRNGSYSAAYPLHDDLLDSRSLRYVLLHQWASVKKCFRYQPLDYIKEYFGVQIGLYFCWLGFYTQMLVPASIVGVFVFALGFIFIERQVCETQGVIYMCPQCDNICDFYDINKACIYFAIISLIDNAITPFYATFMSVWAVLFLQCWKRYSAEVTYKWDLAGYDPNEEVPRPQYLMKIDQYHEDKTDSEIKFDPVTGLEDRTIPLKVLIPGKTMSLCVLALLIVVALAACIGVVVYRMATMHTVLSEGPEYMQDVRFVFLVSASAGVLNLFIASVLSIVYNRVAVFINELEFHRTQTEFDDSLTFKLYLLQFINYYSSVFYIAFFKGKFIGHPAERTKIFGFRQEECQSGGCYLEITLQLATVMVGKQILSAFLESFNPIIQSYVRYGWRKSHRQTFWLKSGSQWLLDYYLVHLDLFVEYLEMVLQFGFLTIFSCAFPLGPVFALINNMFESRLDGRKMLLYYRRPTDSRVSSIGVWINILDFMSKVAVFANAFVIAFTSDFIPKMIYKLFQSTNGTMDGYYNATLSYMRVNDLEKQPDETNQTITYCRQVSGCRYCKHSHPPVYRYKDYREPPWNPNKYNVTKMYWVVLTARFAFVVLYENVVVSLVVIIAWILPDYPSNLKDKIRREMHYIKSLVMEQATGRGSFSENPLREKKSRSDGA